ncbi:molybdopterin molybdotransferase MoeA [Egbenema bharatensis]|uniref:molybdopterin molybdotransferase MoeA n=1 Tax=Egbenema bharatensis TaxID=3463334 RepID=UPI003A83E2EE
MLPAHDAERLILELVTPLNAQRDVETIDLLSASGRVLAADVSGALDFPHWDNSAMDGYAVRYDDVQGCSADHPVTLEIVEEIPAGYQPQMTIQPGQAARILTGSMMPAGADTIVMQEETQREGDRVTILTTPKPKAFVRHRAAFYRAGEPLLPAGISLAAPEIAVLATAQCPSVTVYRRPRVAILSTGNELVSPDEPLAPGQIVDSNQYALASLVAAAGAEPVLMGIIPDQPEPLQQAIANAVSLSDMVLSSGGVSVGDYDYVDRILADLGGTLHIRSVAVKPGKPLTVATFNKPEAQPDAEAQSTHSSPLTPHSSLLYFGLPGNPVSALVSFWRFVQPALRKLSGLTADWHPNFVQGRSHHELRSDGKRETYLWGRVNLVDGVYEFQLAGGSHSSGNLINLAQTNALAIVPVGQTAIAPGDAVQILLIH